MCAALADEYSFDLRSTDRTLLVCAPIYSKIILELTASIHPIERGAIAADPFVQNGADRCMQSLSLFDRDRVGYGERMQPGDV